MTSDQTRALDNALTLPDFLERRFRDQSRLLRVLSAVFILFFFLFYTSAGLVAGGKLFHAVFDLSYTWAVIVGASVVILYTFLGGFLAVAWTDVVQAGIGFFEPRLADADSEKVFIHLVGALFHPVLAGVWLAAILAAIMSTADSQLLVCSSALTEDLYKGLLRPGAGERELVWTGRAAVVVIAVLAMLLARDPESKVLDLVAYAWAGFGAAFGPTLLLALYWGGMSRNGALAGILVGAATVILWKQLQGGIFDLYEMVPGVLFSALAIVLVSRFGPEVEGEVRRQFVSISSPGPS